MKASGIWWYARVNGNGLSIADLVEGYWLFGGFCRSGHCFHRDCGCCNTTRCGVGKIRAPRRSKRRRCGRLGFDFSRAHTDTDRSGCERRDRNGHLFETHPASMISVRPRTVHTCTDPICGADRAERKETDRKTPVASRSLSPRARCDEANASNASRAAF